MKISKGVGLIHLLMTTVMVASDEDYFLKQVRETAKQRMESTKRKQDKLAKYGTIAPAKIFTIKDLNRKSKELTPTQRLLIMNTLSLCSMKLDNMERTLSRPIFENKDHPPLNTSSSVVEEENVRLDVSEPIGSVVKTTDTPADADVSCDVSGVEPSFEPLSDVVEEEEKVARKKRMEALRKEKIAAIKEIRYMIWKRDLSYAATFLIVIAGCAEAYRAFKK